MSISTTITKTWTLVFLTNKALFLNRGSRYQEELMEERSEEIIWLPCLVAKKRADVCEVMRKIKKNKKPQQEWKFCFIFSA